MTNFLCRFFLGQQRPSTGVTQRLKIVPQNQFTTLKPTTQKFYTIESKKTGQKNYIAVAQRAPNRSQPGTPGNSRPSTPHTQFATTSRIPPGGKLPVQQQQQQQHTSFSPPKFTILRQASTVPNTSSTDNELSGTNIFDMPVVFADNEGNIDEDSSNMSDNSVIEIPSDASTGSISKKVILKASNVSSIVNTTATPTVTITKNKNLLIQKPVVPSKMLVLNGNVIGRSIPAQNIVLPKTSTQQAMKIQRIVTTGSSTIPTTSADLKNKLSIPSGKKIEILNNQIIKPASTSIVPTVSKNMTFVNLADAKPINATGRLSLPLTVAKGNRQQIVIKTADLKHFTLAGNKPLTNLTVKKVNVVQSSTPNVGEQSQKPKIIFKNALKE